MKKLSYLVSLFLMCSFTFFISCDDDDNKGGGGNGGGGEDYSDLTPEEQKDKLSEDAIVFLNDMEGLKNNEGLATLRTLNQFLERNPIEVGDDFLSSFEDIIKIEDLFYSFSWDKAEQEWVYTPTTGKGEIIFPVGSENGKVEFTGKSSGVIVDIEDLDDDYDEDMSAFIIPRGITPVEDEDESFVDIPKEISATIYLGNKVVGTVKMTAELVDSSSLPKNIKATYTLGEYTLDSEVVKAAKNRATTNLKKGNKFLMSAAIDLSGDLDELLNEEGDPGQMTGNIVINIMNTLAFTGGMDITKYNEAVDKADEEYSNSNQTSADEKKYVEASSKAFNDYSNLSLVAMQEQNYRIALLRSKAKLYKYPYYSYYEEVPVLKFNDGTEAEAEVYFSEGFDTVFQKIESLIKAFE